MNGKKLIIGGGIVGIGLLLIFKDRIFESPYFKTGDLIQLIDSPTSAIWRVRNIDTKLEIIGDGGVTEKGVYYFTCVKADSLHNVGNDTMNGISDTNANYTKVDYSVDDPVIPDDPAVPSEYSYDIINPRYDNTGMWLTLRNNKIITTNYKYISIGVKVDLLKPLTVWEGSGYNAVQRTYTSMRIFNGNEYDPILPAPGNSVDIFLSAVQLNRDDGYCYMYDLIDEGYIDPNFSPVRITGVSFRRSSGNRKTIAHPPTFPIIVYR
jgi:hypothetical protein